MKDEAPSDGWVVYHGGPQHIKEIEERKLQSRDSGFYGRGFYAAERPEHTRGYGSKVTAVRIAADAKILNVNGLHPDANPEFAQHLSDWHFRNGLAGARKRNKVEALGWEANQIKTDPLAYKSAADRYAENNGYDVVRYSPGEVVVKNLKKASVLGPFKAPKTE